MKGRHIWVWHRYAPLKETAEALVSHAGKKKKKVWNSLTVFALILSINKLSFRAIWHCWEWPHKIADQLYVIEPVSKAWLATGENWKVVICSGLLLNLYILFLEASDREVSHLNSSILH